MDVKKEIENLSEILANELYAETNGLVSSYLDGKHYFLKTTPEDFISALGKIELNVRYENPLPRTFIVTTI